MYLIAGNQKIGHGHYVEILLRTAGLAGVQNSLLNMLATGTGESQDRGGLAHFHGEVKVLHMDFAGPTATTPGKTARLSFGKAETLQLDLVLVFGVGTLALNSVNLQEIVNMRHFETNPPLQSLGEITHLSPQVLGRVLGGASSAEAM